ncbi:hypothetical protein EV122DRAFT_278725 [Schizophyllum commune]
MACSRHRRWLANAVNVSSGLLNATATGQPNDIFKSAASNLPDLTMRGKCVKCFSSWPNATTKGHLNEPIGIVSSTARRLQISTASPLESHDASSFKSQPSSGNEILGSMPRFLAAQCYRIFTEHSKVNTRSSPLRLTEPTQRTSIVKTKGEMYRGQQTCATDLEHDLRVPPSGATVRISAPEDSHFGGLSSAISMAEPHCRFGGCG